MRYPLRSSGSSDYAVSNYGDENSLADRLHRPATITAIGTGVSGHSNGQETFTYSYNGAGRLAGLSSDKSYVNWKTSSTAGTYDAFDRFGRTLSQSWTKVSPTSTILDQVDYTYNAAGNRLTRDVVTSTNNTRDQKYAYDGLHRLLSYDQGTLSSGSITSSNTQRYWELDQLGNWAKLRQGLTNSSTPVLEQRVHNAVNELTDFTDPGSYIDPAHDAAGNMTEAPKPGAPTTKHKYIYDAWNRLVKVTDGSNVTIVTMEYDGLGQRIQKVVSGGDTIDYYYNDQWQLLTEAEDDSIYATYFWHPHYVDALAVRFRDGESHTFLQDANFNVTGAVDGWASSGDYRDVVERYAYSPYGEVTYLDDDFDVVAMQESAIDNQHLYTGRERDPETGLQLNRNRYYAAHLGRWVNRDPIGYAGGFNLYGYLSEKPVDFVDPNGLVPIGPYIPGRITFRPNKPRVVESRGFADELASNLQFAVAANYQLFLDAQNCPLCTKMGIVQIHRWSAAVHRVPEASVFMLGWWYYTELHGRKWRLDGGVPYPESNTVDPSKQLGSFTHSDWIQFTDDPGIDPAGAFGSYFETIMQEFELHVVCLEGSEKGATYGGFYWTHFFDKINGNGSRITPADYNVRRGISRMNNPSREFKAIVGEAL